MSSGRIYVDDAALRQDVAASLGYAGFARGANHSAFKVTASEPAPAPSPAAVEAAEAALRAIFEEIAKEEQQNSEEAGGQD